MRKTLFWILLAMAFNLGVAVWLGREAAIQFLTAYLVEKSLSVDNIFVFLMIFTYFDVPARYQPKVLYWRVGGAVVLRAIFIFGGIALIHRFHWITYLFGFFLAATGVR